MSFLTNAKVATKLAVSSGIGILLILGMIVNQQISSDKITAANQAVEREQTILNGILGAQLALSQMRYGAVALADAKAEPEAQTALDGIKRSSRAAWDGLETPIAIALKPDVLKDIRSSLRDYEAAVAARASANDLRAIVERASTAIDASVTNAQNFTGQARAALASAVSQANLVAIAVGTAIVLVLIASAAILIMTMGRPIRIMTQTMRRLAEGDTTIELSYANRKDEVGDMAAAVEVFRQSAIANARLESEATDNRRRAEEERIAAQHRAETEAAARLTAATSGLAAGLKQLAGGDLAFQLDEAFAPEFEALRRDFNTSVRQLGDTLSAISRSTSMIESGTREINQAAANLSKRTEQQASSLEESAAALDEITVNVNSSSTRAEEARRMANEANVSASSSGEVVSRAVAAMSRIEQSSNQISNIIGIIDEIAFQTNLLALNAGVEAARAGEAGKGFAVVAQEVRELAQRSAQAAKEIKGLIQASSGEVSSGVELVSETGKALKTIEGYIASINQHMEAIATSTREQSVGLSEVNTSINQMDQMTQQNAAMVEQTTASSASLAQEAESLQQMVARFTLVDAGAESGVSPLRSAAHKMPAARPPVVALKPTGRGGAARKPAAAEAQAWGEF